MASFDYFSEPSRIKLDTNLFAENAAAGLAAAKQLPSTATSIIQGLIGGYEEGQKIRTADQQIQLNDNTIQQLPVQNARQQEALTHDQQQTQINANTIQQLPVSNAQQQENLEQQQIVNDLNKMKLETAQATQTLNKETAIQTATGERDKAVQAAQTAKLQNSLLEDLKSQDSQVLKGIVFGPKYQGILAQDPKTAEQVINSVASRADLSDAERSKLYDRLDFQKKQEQAFELQKLELGKYSKYAENLQKARSDFAGSGVSYYAKGLPEQELFNNVEIHPAGAVTYDRATGELIPNTPVTPPRSEGGAPKYWVFRKNDQGNLTFRGETDEKGYGDFEQYRLAREGTVALLNHSLYGNFTGAPKQEQPKPQAKQEFFGPGIPAGQQNNELPPAAPRVQSPKSAQLQAQTERMTPTSGVSAGTLKNQIMQENQKYTQRRQSSMTDKPAPTETPDSSGLKDQLSAVGGVGAASTQQQANEVEVPDPDAALSKVLGRDVVLNTERLPMAYRGVLNKEIYARVQSEPLLKDQPALIKGLAAIESEGKREAVSPTKVRGLLQVQKSTAAMYGLNRDIPEEGVAAGVMYLTDQLMAFGGNLRFALAAYNAGPGYIKEAIRNVGNRGEVATWDNVKEELRSTLSPQKFKETSMYPDKVINASASFMQEGSDESHLFAELLHANGIAGKSKPSAVPGSEGIVTPSTEPVPTPLGVPTPPSQDVPTPPPTPVQTPQAEATRTPVTSPTPQVTKAPTPVAPTPTGIPAPAANSAPGGPTEPGELRRLAPNVPKSIVITPGKK